MRIGVIGSGIAGIVVSRRLSHVGHAVTLFERQDSIGIDAHSINVPVDGDSGQSVRVDVPSRMFNQSQWPALWALYEETGVARSPVDTTQSFGQQAGETWMTLLQANRPGAAKPGLGSKGLLSARNRAVLKEAQRLQQSALADLQAGIDPALGFSEYLQRGGYSQEFVFGFLFPTLSSTVFTCGFQSLGQYPAETVLGTLRNLVDDEAQLFRAANGTRDVAQRILTEDIQLRTGCGVEAVRVVDDGVTIECQSGEASRFDHLIVATQANSAIRLLPELPDIEREILECFTYETIPVFVHSDPDLMPSSRRHWSTFNMLTDGQRQAAMCSVWLNRFHDNWPSAQNVFQTINAFARPEDSRIIRECKLQRPVVNQRSVSALHRLEALHADPTRRIWYCGSYASQGTPLLESGVRSAENVARLIGQIVPV